MSLVRHITFVAAVAAGLGTCANAQSAPGTDWSSGWSFRNSNQVSVGTSRANIMLQARKSAGPSTVVNTTNYYNTDNRTNYMDVATDGDVSTDFQVGDDIGQNTNSVGSMNTGNTTIDVAGSNNMIDAVNSADNTGCVDGSVFNGSVVPPAFSDSLGLTAPGAQIGSSRVGGISNIAQACSR